MEKVNEIVLGVYCGTDCFRVAVFCPEIKQEIVEKGKTSDLLALRTMELLSKCNLKPQNLTTIAVCVGPGSFTSSRVAVSFVKGLACALQKVKIVPFSTFDFLSFEKNADAVLVPAFSDYVFVRTDKDFCTQYSNSFEGNIVADEYTFEKWGKGKRIEPNNNFVAFVEHMSKQKGVATKNLKPIYLRASQAEIEREKKHGNKS